jgi:hypothetical protein
VTSGPAIFERFFHFCYLQQNHLSLVLDHHFNKDLALAAEAKSRSPALRSERRPVNVEEFQHS